MTPIRFLFNLIERNPVYLNAKVRKFLISLSIKCVYLDIE